MQSKHFRFGRAAVVLCSAFLITGLLCSAQAARQIKVIIDNASIRSRPELDAEILDIAAKGALLEVIEKAGSWYAIKMGEDEAGKPIWGYIHESMVEPPPAPELQVIPPPPAAEEPSSPTREVQDAQVEVRSLDKLISGSFLKYGFGDHWLASFGFDAGLGRHVGLGLEFQPYVQNLSETGFTVIQMDVFANLKLGFKLWHFTLYGGGGIGPDFSYTSSEIGDESVSKFRAMLAYHAIAGVALHIGRIALVFEYQPTLVSNPDVDPDTWGQFFFIGLKF